MTSTGNPPYCLVLNLVCSGELITFGSPCIANVCSFWIICSLLTSLQGLHQGNVTHLLSRLNLPSKNPLPYENGIVLFTSSMHCFAEFACFLQHHPSYLTVIVTHRVRNVASEGQRYLVYCLPTRGTVERCFYFSLFYFMFCLSVEHLCQHFIVYIYSNHIHDLSIHQKSVLVA